MKKIQRMTKRTEKTWKTQDGRKIPIADMETSHIKAALAMLKRKGFYSVSTFLAYVSAPYEKMGDGAQMAFEQEWEHLMSLRGPLPQIDWLEDELNRRRCRGTKRN